METEWQNVKDPDSRAAGQRLLGRTDVPLSKEGMVRSEKLAAALQKEPLVAIHSSPLQRARVLADMVSGASGVPVVYTDALREIDFGDCEGLVFEDVEKQFPNTHHAYLSGALDIAFPNGESFPAFRARVGRWLEELVATGQDGTHLVVTHGGVTRAALCYLLGWPPETFWHIKQDYGCMNVVGVYGSVRVIERINQHV